VYGGGGDNGEKGKNSDLKIGHVRVQFVCIRTYVSAFDRTCVGCV
jgi:hypothetical protein